MLLKKRPGISAALLLVAIIVIPGLFVYFTDPAVSCQLDSQRLDDTDVQWASPEAIAQERSNPSPSLSVPTQQQQETPVSTTPEFPQEPVQPDTVDLSHPPEAPSNYHRGAYYIVISRRLNHLWLMKDGQVELDAVCATGKGDTLVWERGGKTWVFETPTGEFTVQYKTDSPRWVPPEWDFVERNEEPPDWIARSRAASYEMLGDYSINIGGDLNIHGTLYENLLGRSITHGCIRVGAVNLGHIYNRIRTGSKVYIY